MTMMFTSVTSPLRTASVHSSTCTSLFHSPPNIHPSRLASIVYTASRSNTVNLMVSKTSRLLSASVFVRGWLLICRGLSSEIWVSKSLSKKVSRKILHLDRAPLPSHSSYRISILSPPPKRGQTFGIGTQHSSATIYETAPSRYPLRNAIRHQSLERLNLHGVKIRPHL